MEARENFVDVLSLRVKKEPLKCETKKTTEQVVPPTHMNIGPSTTIATFIDATVFTCIECMQYGSRCAGEMNMLKKQKSGTAIYLVLGISISQLCTLMTTVCSAALNAAGFGMLASGLVF